MARPTPKRSRQHQSKPQPTVFARRLKAAMDERGWTANETARRVREELGEGAKFTPANISHYRQGRSLPRPRYLEALSRALGVDKGELLTEASPARDGDRQQHTPPSSAPIELPTGHRRSISRTVAAMPGCRLTSNCPGRRPSDSGSLERWGRRRQDRLSQRPEGSAYRSLTSMWMRPPR